MTKADGERIANALISDDPETAKAAARELSKAPPSISDPTARALARIIGEGGEPAEAVSRLLGKTQAKWFGGRGYGKLQRTVLGIYADGGSRGKAVEGAAMYLNRGPDKRYIEKRIAHEPPGGSSWPARVWSVRRSIWVMALYGLVLLIGVPMAFVEPLIVVPLLLAGFALCVGIDGWRRKCPQCSMILGAERVGLVNTEHGSLYKWRCVGCGHRWEATKYH